MMLATLLLSASPLTAQDAGGASADAAAMLDPAEMQRIEAAVDKALEYLVAQQRPDGSWPSGYGNNNGVNAVCLLALLGRGHTPSRGPYQAPILKAINFIYATQNDAGLYVSPNKSHGPMYGHALSTLAMIESYGYFPEPRLHASIQKALDLIVKAQTPQGGWRYQPVPTDADLSVTVMQVVALHAGRNAQFRIPEETFEKALQYARSCVVPTGGFTYQSGKGGPAPPRTAAGILCMQLLGAFDDPAVAQGLEWLNKIDYKPQIGHFWYMNYYAMQASFQAGGEYWTRWSGRAKEFLLRTQDADGSWPSYTGAQFNGNARCYSTAFGAMSLQVFLHYLPAYQR